MRLIQEELEKNGSPRVEFFTDEDRRTMRIRIPIHLAFLKADDEVLLPDSYEKATKKLFYSKDYLKDTGELRRIKRADLFEFMIHKVRRMDKPELLEGTNLDQESHVMKMEKESADSKIWKNVLDRKAAAFSYYRGWC